MALEGGEGSASRPGRSVPPGKSRYPLYRRLGGPLSRSGQVQKMSPPPGFGPRNEQSVASQVSFVPVGIRTLDLPARSLAAKPTPHSIAQIVLQIGGKVRISKGLDFGNTGYHKIQ